MSTREMYVDGVEERIAEAVRAERERVLAEVEKLSTRVRIHADGSVWIKPSDLRAVIAKMRGTEGL